MNNVTSYRQHRGRGHSALLLALLSMSLTALPVSADTYQTIDLEERVMSDLNNAVPADSGWLPTAAIGISIEGGIIGTG